MSILLKLGPNMKNIQNLLDQYTEDLIPYANNLTIDNKTLEKCLKEQATWCAYYGERNAELSTIIKHIENQIKRIRGILTVQYNENYNPKLSERVTDKYIDRENDYLDIYSVLLEVQELKSKYENVLEAFKSRGYALRNITEARINEINQVTL